jgi:GT2 family glycosyltransferase
MPTSSRDTSLESLATIVVTQREVFGATRESLESIVALTRPGYKLVYVDGGSPWHTRRYLRRQLAELGFEYIRKEYYLTPNEARNVGLQRVRTKYAVFIDNDVVVAPGWLEALIECAEETSAAVVGPIYCIGTPLHQKVHVAGGECRIVDEGGKRTFQELHDYVDRPLAEALSTLQRAETGLVEFHCVLIRSDMLDRIGPFDERLYSTPEHCDLSLLVLQAGGSVYLEPRSVVTQLEPRIGVSELRFFALRWNRAWYRASLTRFAEKWGLSDDQADWQQLLNFLEFRRKMYYKSLGLQPVRSLLLALRGQAALQSFDDAVDRLATRILVRPAGRKRPRQSVPVP